MHLRTACANLPDMVPRSEISQVPPRLTTAGREALSEVGWLSKMPDDFRQAILNRTIFRAIEPGVEFVHAGDQNGLFAVATGIAEMSFCAGHPELRAIHLVQGGFWGGYKSLIGEPYHIGLTARTAVISGVIPLSQMQRLLTDNPQWWFHILQLLDQMVMVAVDGFADLTRHSSEIRAIAMLLRLGDCRHRDPPDGMVPEIRLSQVELASMAVMSRNTFQGVMSRLAEQGLVEIGYRSLFLKRPAELRSLVEADY